MSDRGAKALADRGTGFWFGNPKAAAEHILGTTGLFIPDVTKHEPIGSARQEAAGRGSVDCICGHLTSNTESYFDHIGAGPISSGEAAGAE